MRHSWLTKVGVLRLNLLLSGTYNTFYHLLYSGMPGASTTYFTARIYAYGMVPGICQLLKLSPVIVSSVLFTLDASRRGKRWYLLAIKNARHEPYWVEGEKNLLRDPGSELRLGGREKKGEGKKWDAKKTIENIKIINRSFHARATFGIPIFICRHVYMYWIFLYIVCLHLRSYIRSRFAQQPPRGSLRAAKHASLDACPLFSPRRRILSEYRRLANDPRIPWAFHRPGRHCAHIDRRSRRGGVYFLSSFLVWCIRPYL